MSHSENNGTNDEWLLRRQACPMSAGVNWDPTEDSRADMVKWYSYYNKLPRDIRLGLADETVLQAVLLIAKNNNVLDEFKVGEISRMIRESFFKVSERKEVEKRAQERIGISEDKSSSFYEGFKEIVKLVQVVGREKLEKVTEEIPIIPALKKYPGLGEQVLTGENIKKRDTSDFVRPVLSNWIDDYIQRKGAQSHDNIDRSDFLFNSENGKKISVDERKILGRIFDSYDNDVNLKVHIENQEIIFSEGYRPEENKRVLESVKTKNE